MVGSTWYGRRAERYDWKACPEHLRRVVPLPFVPLAEESQPQILMRIVFRDTAALSGLGRNVGFSFAQGPQLFTIRPSSGRHSGSVFESYFYFRTVQPQFQRNSQRLLARGGQSARPDGGRAGCILHMECADLF